MIAQLYMKTDDPMTFLPMNRRAASMKVKKPERQGELSRRNHIYLHRYNFIYKADKNDYNNFRGGK